MLFYIVLIITFFVFVSGVDDLVFDLLYIFRGRKKVRRLKMHELFSVPYKRIAIMIPTWKESSVIGKMVNTTLNFLNYPKNHYQIFIGVYPNDPETQMVVDELVSSHDNVHKVINKNLGPTSKADNLNSIYHYIKEYEKTSGKTFSLIVLHDAEDLVHPISLKLFNYLLTDYDMVQIPVFPVQPKPSLTLFFRNLTSSTYADEFAENHLRHMLSREGIGGFIPSAGVGTAVNTKALNLLAEDLEGSPFNPLSKTEDYELALRLANKGGKIVYFLEGVERIDRNGNVQVEYISTRSTFPNRFWQAINQKTRWVYGITMQTFKGNLLKELFKKGVSVAQKYSIYRDIKPRYTNLFNLLVYPIMFILLWQLWILNGSLGDSIASGFLGWLLLINGIFLLWRQGIRFFAITQQYGIIEAVYATLVPPIFPIRYIWGNIINFMATLRAWNLYLFGKEAAKSRWIKTEHTYVPEEIISEHHRRIGDILLERGYLKIDELRQALKTQREKSGKLGELLIEMGYLDEDKLLSALAEASNVGFLHINEALWDVELASILPYELARKYQVLPVVIHKGGLVVATPTLLSPEAKQELEKTTNLKISEVFATNSDVQRGLMAVYNNTNVKTEPVKKSGFRLGTILLDLGLINTDDLIEALEIQSHSKLPLGKILIDGGYISEIDLALAISQQHK